MSQTADDPIQSVFDSLLNEDPLLNEDDRAEVDAMVPDDAKAASTADVAVTACAMPAPVIQGAQQAAAAAKPSITGKKRQLLVPQASNKRPSVKAQSPKPSTSEASALAPKDPSPANPASPVSAAAAAEEPAKAEPKAEPEPSAASSPTKAKAQADPADDAPAADQPSADMETDADKAQEVHDEAADAADTEMTDAPGADEQEEVQSPLKKAPAPDEDPAEEPSTTATAAAPAPGGGPSRAKLVVKSAAATPSTSTAPSAASKLTSSKPAATKPKKPAAAAAAGGGKGAGAAAALPKMPKATNAFMFFSADTRTALKETEPGLSLGETTKRVAAMWKELSEDEKKPYHDMAAEDKERVKLEIAAMDPETLAAIQDAAAEARAAKKDKGTDKKAEPAAKEAKAEAAKEAKKGSKAASKADKGKEAKKEEKAAAKAAKAEAAKRDKAGFQVFHSSQFGTIKADNPGADVAEINALVQKAWEAKEQADKDAYIKKAEEAAEAAAAAKAMNCKAPAKSKTSKSAGKRSKKASGGGEDEHSDGEATEATGGGGSSRRRAAAAEEEDDDSDREDIDWDTNPATAILSHGAGAFLVPRAGLMLTEYGKVDTRKAKERLLNGGAGSSSEAVLPVSAQQIEEYERSCQKFWAALKGRMNQGSLYLEELEEQSPLEMCYLLGKLQEKGMELDPTAKHPKSEPDVVRRLPVMRLSKVMQRLVDMERSNTREARQEAEQLKTQVAALKAEIAELKKA